MTRRCMAFAKQQPSSLGHAPSSTGPLERLAVAKSSRRCSAKRRGIGRGLAFRTVPYRRSSSRSRNGTPSQMATILSKSSWVSDCCTSGPARGPVPHVGHEDLPDGQPLAHPLDLELHGGVVDDVGLVDHVVLFGASPAGCSRDPGAAARGPHPSSEDRKRDGCPSPSASASSSVKTVPGVNSLSSTPSSFCMVTGRFSGAIEPLEPIRQARHVCCLRVATVVRPLIAARHDWPRAAPR